MKTKLVFEMVERVNVTMKAGASVLVSFMFIQAVSFAISAPQNASFLIFLIALSVGVSLFAFEGQLSPPLILGPEQIAKLAGDGRKHKRLWFRNEMSFRSGTSFLVLGVTGWLMFDFLRAFAMVHA